jgi:hypothetical protein
MSASETFARVRSVMPDVSPIDLDEHARRIAETVYAAERNSIARAASVNGAVVSDLVLRLHDALQQPRAGQLAREDSAARLVTEGA